MSHIIAIINYINGKSVFGTCMAYFANSDTIENGDIGINDKCVRLSADDCSLYWITSPEDCLKL